MRIAVFLLLVSLFYVRDTLAQSCGCNKTITASSSYLVDGNTLNIHPGDTICIMAGTRSNLTFRNLAGTAEEPIVIINCGGKAIINSITSYGLKFERSHHFKITGTGSADSLGLEIMNTYHGIYLADFTTDFEIDHIDIHDIPFAGIMAKTDPLCSDTNTWRQNFTMRNVSIHHNYIHTTVNGEGMYIGYSFFANGITCGLKTAYPHAIENIKVYNNRTENTGCEGIQVGCATKGCEVYNNRVESFGQRPFTQSASQQNGIQIGEGTGGLCYGNFVKADSINRGANGIIVLGIGDNYLFNNVIINPALSGFFIDERPPALITDTVSGYWIINNTIINPGTDGIKTYAELANLNEIKNNIIINPGSGKYINTTGGPGVPFVIKGNNYFSTTITNVKFVAPDSNDFHLTALSPCIDAAENSAHWNIFKDHSGVTRPKGVAFDIGAFEFDTTLVNLPPTVSAGNDTIILAPIDSLNISGIVSDPDGLVDTYYWTAISPDSIKIVQPDSLATLVNKLKIGANIVTLTVIDNGNKSTSDTLVISVKNQFENYIPTVYAGKDTSFMLPVNAIPLKGSLIDSSQTFLRFHWRQISGPGMATIEDSTILNTSISNLLTGQYVFRLIVSNDLGLFYYDDVIISTWQNASPMVNAGVDKRVSNRLTTFVLIGSASDSGGSISTIEWSQIDGVSVTLLNRNTLNAQIANFETGTYSFRLTVTDNLGVSNYDDVIITVNQSPVANAGADRLVSSLSNTTITGFGNDPEGDQITYQWTKVSGPSVTLSGSSTQNLFLSNLNYGNYTFRLTVKDSYGDFTVDDMVLIVNRPPIANAGANKTIRLAQSPYVMSGSGSDQDGTIVSYSWTKVSGPSVTMSNISNPSLTISNFQKGTYVFRLTVTDNRGSTSSDDVTINAKR